MNLKIKSLITFVILAAFSYSKCGTITSPTITMIGKQFTSNGILDGKKIYLTFDKLNFTGTIICSDECIIKCKEPFDYNMFKREGSGKFKVIINPNEFDVCNGEQLRSITQNLCSNILNFDNSDISNIVNEIKCRASISDLKIDEEFKLIFDDLDFRIKYQQEQLAKESVINKNNDEYLKKGVALGLVALMGYGITIGNYIKDVRSGNAANKSNKLIVGTLLSSIPALLALKSLGQISIVNHEESIKKLIHLSDFIKNELEAPIETKKIEVINL